ncbi:MAG TPA: MauE/DoxX family redox-associated membrane protein, partial [Egicoccus sp.]
MSFQLGGAWPGLVATVQVVALVGAGLLVPAGTAKLRRPADAADALGWRSVRAHAAVRAVGVGELALAAVVVVSGGPMAAALLVLAYLVFAAVALRQRSRGASCGCFGQADAPAGLLHVGINLVVATAAAVAASGSVPLGVGSH